MIARYSQIQQQVAALASLLKQPGHVQKIYSTSRFLCFQVRFPGRSITLYLGRGSGAEGLWMGSEVPRSFLRLRDKWLEWCRKNFTSSLLVEARMDPADRTIALVFQKGGHKFTWHVAWIGRQCFFYMFDHHAQKGFSSWEGALESYRDYSEFDSVGRKRVDDEKTQSELPPIEKLLEEEEELARRSALPKQKIRSLKIKQGKITGDLEKISQWGEFQGHLAQLDPLTLTDLKRFDFRDLSYKFPLGLTTWQKRDWLFQQVKRLKLAEELQRGRLQQCSDELEKILKTGDSLENPLRPLGPVWKTMATPKEPSKDGENDFVVHSFSGYKIGVGISAKGNDQLRKHWGKPDDWWVHAASGVSAHAIIKHANPGIPTPQQLLQAARLIAKQSRITATEMEIISTQVKNVRGVTGTPGMVTFKKSKNLLCDLSEGEIE